jgi:hypothetical protein
MPNAGSFSVCLPVVHANHCVAETIPSRLPTRINTARRVVGGSTHPMTCEYPGE